MNNYTKETMLIGLPEGVFKRKELGYGCKFCDIGMMNRGTAMKHTCAEYKERLSKKNSMPPRKVK